MQDVARTVWEDRINGSCGSVTYETPSDIFAAEHCFSPSPTTGKCQHCASQPGIITEPCCGSVNREWSHMRGQERTLGG